MLVSYGGRPIRSHADFGRWVVYQPGQRVPVVVLREGRPQTIYVVYQQQRSGNQYQAEYGQSTGGAYLGVTFDQQNSRQARIRTVNPGSPAERAGLRPGDVIVALNGNQIGGSQDVIQAVSSMQPGAALDVAVSRQVVLGNRPGVAQASYDANESAQASVVTSAEPTVSDSATAGSARYRDGAIRGNVPNVPGTRADNRAARPGDADRDGRVLDGDGRVGPVERRAIRPRRRD